MQYIKRLGLVEEPMSGSLKCDCVNWDDLSSPDSIVLDTNFKDKEGSVETMQRPAGFAWGWRLIRMEALAVTLQI